MVVDLDCSKMKSDKDNANRHRGDCLAGNLNIHNGRLGVLMSLVT